MQMIADLTVLKYRVNYFECIRENQNQYSLKFKLTMKIFSIRIKKVFRNKITDKDNSSKQFFQVIKKLSCKSTAYIFNFFNGNLKLKLSLNF